jgi:hypothetical protein
MKDARAWNCENASRTKPKFEGNFKVFALNEEKFVMLNEMSKVT